MHAKWFFKDRAIFSIRIQLYLLPRINKTQIILRPYCYMKLVSLYISLFAFWSANKILYSFIYFSPKFISDYSKVILNLRVKGGEGEGEEGRSVTQPLLSILFSFCTYAAEIEKSEPTDSGYLPPQTVYIWHDTFQTWFFRILTEYFVSVGLYSFNIIHRMKIHKLVLQDIY